MQTRNLTSMLARLRLGNNENSAEANRLAEVFRPVRSETDCSGLLASEGLLEPTGLTDSVCSLLVRVCKIMRSGGMAMEPNLLGRTAARAVLDRPLAGAMSTVFASTDTDFLSQIARADASRDRQDYSSAQQDYWLALQMYPAHFGYLIQYGHCLKERNLLPDALVIYLDALYFGAPKDQIAIHAEYVGSLIGRLDQVEKLLNQNVSSNPDPEQGAMGLPLTSKDVIVLTQLLHIHTPPPDQIAQRMCEYRNRRELALALLGEAQFVRSHQTLLRVLSETGFGTAK